MSGFTEDTRDYPKKVKRLKAKEKNLDRINRIEQEIPMEFKKLKNVDRKIVIQEESIWNSVRRWVFNRFFQIDNLNLISKFGFGSVLTGFFLSLTILPLNAQINQQPYALLIAGIGGSKEYDEKFRNYLFDTRKALIDRFRFSESNIIVLAGKRSDGDGFIDGISNADNIRTHFANLSSKITENDDLYVFLFGHGSFNNKNALLNIPRKDLTDSDYAILLKTINARKIIFVNTASCSGPFVKTLSSANRIIISATKSGRERNETLFPKYMIEAMNNPGSDLDKDGNLNVAELFLSASELTQRWYEDNNHIATEHALLDDTGDGVGYRSEELMANAEGILASRTYFKKERMLQMTATGIVDTVLVKLMQDQEKVEEEISLLKVNKTNYSEDEYYAMLEPLFIRLAIINDQLDELKGGGE